jgi:hypothetical protein
VTVGLALRPQLMNSALERVEPIVGTGFASGQATNKEIEQDDDLTESHLDLACAALSQNSLGDGK